MPEEIQKTSKRRSPTITRNTIKELIVNGSIIKNDVEKTLILNVSHADTDEVTGEVFDVITPVNLTSLLGITVDMIENIFTAESKRAELDNAKIIAIQALKDAGLSDESISKILAKGN